MSEKKCSSQDASHYINDLFDTLEIKGNNQLLFNQFCSILMKYSLETIKKSWSEIFNSCDLPNGQLAGRLPKMQIIERILMANRIEKFDKKHIKNNSKVVNEEKQVEKHIKKIDFCKSSTCKCNYYLF